MTRALRVDTDSAVPIWFQIEEGVRRLVASGALAAGGAVPSVRELARELRVNPATVSKAYQRLADAGVLQVRRGDGTYVAESPPALGRTEKSRTLREGAARYAGVALTVGASCQEAGEELQAAWRQLERGGKGER